MRTSISCSGRGEDLALGRIFGLLGSAFQNFASSKENLLISRRPRARRSQKIAIKSSCMSALHTYPLAITPLTLHFPPPAE